MPNRKIKKEQEKDLKRTATVLSTTEIVDRFGNANAEFIKGYRGVDNETGQVFAKGLSDIAKHKINPKYAKQNIKQQAGYSAEVASTSRDNAEAIINKSAARTSRSDDLAHYGRNHNVVDRVQILDGEIIVGTETQMKFVGNRDQLFRDIAKPDGKFARYRGVKLELPSEQMEGAKEFCLNQSEKLIEQAKKVEKKGDFGTAAKLREEAKNYKKLSTDLKDSGLATKEAIQYRLKPKLETAKDIARTSHRAGLEGAQMGAIIGGSISLVQNFFYVAQGEKELDVVVMDVAKTTALAAGTGYSTAAIGSAIKSGLQQSSSQTLRQLANTSAPAMVVNICLSLGSSIKRLAMNEIDGVQFLEEVGEKGAGMLSAGMMATLGQITIPIPVVGAMLGGMIGYSMSQVFYQSVLGAMKEAKLAQANYERVKQMQTMLRERVAEERRSFEQFMHNEMQAIRSQVQTLFDAIDNIDADINHFAMQINQFSELLGKELAFKNRDEFDDFMLNSDDVFKL